MNYSELLNDNKTLDSNTKLKGELGHKVYINGKLLGIIEHISRNRGNGDTTYQITCDKSTKLNQFDLSRDVRTINGDVIGTITGYKLLSNDCIDVRVRSGPKYANLNDSLLTTSTDNQHPTNNGISSISTNLTSKFDFVYYKTEDERDESMDKLECRLEILERYCLMLELSIKQAGIELPMNLFGDDI